MLIMTDKNVFSKNNAIDKAEEVVSNKNAEKKKPTKMHPSRVLIKRPLHRELVTLEVALDPVH